MDTATLEQLKAEIGNLHTWVQQKVDAGVKPLEEETRRLATSLLQVNTALKQGRRADLLHAFGTRDLRVPSGKYAGMDRISLAIAKGIMRDQPTDGSPGYRAMLEKWRANLAAALDSTTTGEGDELVPTQESATMWEDVNLETSVLGLFSVIPMPTNPFDIPLTFGDVNWYPGVENTATKSTAPATGKRTMTAYELVGQVPLSYDLEEDAVIAIMDELRRTIVRNAAEIIDNVLINADTTLTNGINSDGATIAADTPGKGHWLLGFDGLRHSCLIDATGQANDKNAAADDAMFAANLKLLGKYGVRPSQVAHIMGIRTYIQAMMVSNFRTLDKFGPQATILQGQLGAVAGIPVIVAEGFLMNASDGKVTDGVAGTTGDLLTVNRTAWKVGFKRELTIETERSQGKRQNIVTASFRIAFLQREATIANQTHTALQYDITGV